MKNIAQSIVDTIEEQDLGLAFVGGNSLKNELFFETNTGEVDEDYLDVAYEEASMVTSVKVYAGDFDGQPVLVIQKLEE